MKIFTSYFPIVIKLDSSRFTPIAICAKPPKWFDGYNYRKLAPSYEVLTKYRKDYDEVSYTKSYEREILSCLSVEEVIHDLETLVNPGTDAVLLCYEVPTKFCHRHLVSKWLNEHGYHCEEL